MRWRQDNGGEMLMPWSLVFDFKQGPKAPLSLKLKSKTRRYNDDHANIGLDLISLNKYVVTLIKAQAKSCLTYNSFFVAATPLPFIEKILLLLRPNNRENCRYNWSFHSIRELFFQKFVLSSIIRCLKIQPYHSFLHLKVSLFSLKVLFHS